MLRENLTKPEPVAEAALRLAREVGLSFTAADVLTRRGFQAGAALDRFLAPKLAHLTSPDAMADLDPAADRIARAIRARERIVVFGDYDCDGITATAIMTEVIDALGGEVTPQLASRFAGGYGFSQPALERAIEARARLIVTCDCGSADHERIEAAQRVGIDTVVIDHHLVPEQPLPAVAFLNPHRPNCGFPYKGLASCGLALILATRLRKVMDAELDVRRWLDLVAIGTVADVAPLDGDNRALVRAGLKAIAHDQRVGLAALVADGQRGKRRPVTAEDVAYQIAPRLNAPGRLADPMLSLRALTARAPSAARELAAEIGQMSEDRRAIQRTMIEQATSDIDEGGWADDAAIVVARQGWHPGVVGIVAGRLADRYRCPAIVVGLEGETGRGSARAPTGFRLYDSLVPSAEELTKFGGHQAAAGVELRADRVEAFRALWREHCAAQTRAQPLTTEPDAEVCLDPRDDIMAVVADFERIEPCGEKNPAPRVWVDATIVEIRAIREHLKLQIDVNGCSLSAFAPDQSGCRDALAGGAAIHVIGKLKRDHWRGGATAEILVTGMRLARA